MTDIRFPPFPPTATSISEDGDVYFGNFWSNWFISLVNSVIDIIDEVEVIKYHFHNKEHWFGIASPQTAANWGTYNTIAALS